LSGELVQAAHCLLTNSLEERKEGVWREPDNHCSLYAPGVIAMVVTAVDAWLNEIIGHSRQALSEERITDLVDRSTIVDKFRDIARELSGKPLAVPSDFRLLIAVRNEIVHFLPYVQLVASGNTVPSWLGELGRKRLLISTGNPTAEFHFGQKLCSYALGYWACQTVHLAAQAMVPSLGQNSIGGLAANFGFYQRVTGPADLRPYDHRFGLTLSR
jgi:hypothetical protein